MSLLTELDAFYTEHRRCGELEAGVEGPVVDGVLVWGGRIAEAAVDMAASRNLSDYGAVEVLWSALLKAANLHAAAQACSDARCGRTSVLRAASWIRACLNSNA